MVVIAFEEDPAIQIVMAREMPETIFVEGEGHEPTVGRSIG